MPSVQAAGTAMLVPLAPYPTPVPFTPPNGMDSNLALQEHSYFLSFFSLMLVGHLEMLVHAIVFALVHSFGLEIL
jgi:hypothetical protein